MGQLKKTNIYITGNRPPMENVVFGSPLTVTTEITDSEENQKHTWYKLTTPNPSSGNIHSYRSAKIEFTTTEDNIEVEFKIKAQTNWDGSVTISALDYYTDGVINADYSIATIYGNLVEKIIKYQVPTKGKHFIQFEYVKGSNNSGDGAYICAWSNLNMPISEVKSVYVENSKIQQMNVQGKNLFEYELGNTVSWKTMKYNKTTKQFTYDTNDTTSELYKYLRITNIYKPKMKFFLRAESFYNFSSEIENLAQSGYVSLYKYYGGDLHKCSHGESFLKVMQNRFTDHGLYILDEPEAALSAQSQLSLLCLIDDLVKQGSQFIIATHSPILISYRNAKILDLNKDFQEVKYEDTDIYQLYKLYMENPYGMQKKLFDNNEE